MAADGSIIIDTRINTDGLNQLPTDLNSVFGKIGGTVKKIGASIGTAFAVREIVQFGQECIELGSDLQEVQNVVDVTFGSMSAGINEFAKTALESFGLSEMAAKQYTSTMGAMLKSMGFTVDEASDMSMELAGLAGDMASFYNLDTADAFAKIRSGISGETEPLKQLGINLSVANLEQYALTKGITKSYNAMTQQEQALLRYNYLLSVTSDAQGDFSRTSEGWANQTRILSEQFNSLKATIGQGLINALTPVLGVINSILAALQKLATAFQQVMTLLFGSAGGLGGGAAMDAAEGYSAAADAAEDYASGAGKAAAAADKFDNGLDEIKKFEDESSGGGGGGGGADGAGGIAEELLAGAGANAEKQEDVIPLQVEAIVNKILELVDPLKNIDFSSAITELSGLGSALGDLGAISLEYLEWAWFNILAPLATWTVEESAPAVISLLTSAFSALSAVLAPVGDGLMQLYGWLSPVFLFIQDTAIWVCAQLQALFESLAQMFSEKGPEISGIISNIGEVLSVVWSWMEPVLTDMRDFFGVVFGFIIELVSETIGGIIDVLYSLTEFLAGVFTGDWDRAWSGLAGIFEGWYAWVIGVAEDFLAAFGPIFEEVATAVGGVWDSICEYAAEMWSGLVTTIVDAVNAIIGGINSLISGAVGGINSVIGLLNSFSFTIPDWVPEYGGSSFSLDIGYVSAPQIPYLAKGAVIPPHAPFYAVLGDQQNGMNLEAPESLLRKIVREESGSQSGGGQYQFTAQINRRTLFDEIITEAQLRRIQSGKNPFEL